MSGVPPKPSPGMSTGVRALLFVLLALAALAIVVALSCALLRRRHRSQRWSALGEVE